jgi:hypothetical protein
VSVKCQKSFTLTVNAQVSLQAYWAFEQASAPWLDSVGAKHLLAKAIDGSPTVGIVNDGILIPVSGTASVPGVDSGYAASALFDPVNGATVAGWVKRNINSPSGVEADVFFEWIGADAFLSPIFDFQLTGRGIFVPTRFRLQLTTVLNTEAETYDLATLGSWFFFVFWMDPADNLVRFQLNDGAINVFVTPIAIPATSTQSTVVIRGANGNQSGQFVVDELGIWSKVLSAAERTDLYNGGAGRTYPNVPT